MPDWIRIVSVIGSEFIPLGAVPPEALEGVLRAVVKREVKPDGSEYTDAEILAAIERARAPWRRIQARAEAALPPAPPFD